MLEMVRTLAGFHEERDGFLTIRPLLFDLPDLSGKVLTRQGIVSFSYQQASGRLRATLTLPKGAKGLLLLPDGTSHPLTEGEQVFGEE